MTTERASFFGYACPFCDHSSHPPRQLRVANGADGAFTTEQWINLSKSWVHTSDDRSYTTKEAAVEAIKTAVYDGSSSMVLTQ
jgi:hypothetical protein